MYYHGYCYYYPAGCIFNCFYNCSDQCELLWWYDGFSYGDSHGWYGSLYVQLEYDAGADGCYRYGSGSRHLYGDDHGCRRLYDDGYGYDH